MTQDAGKLPMGVNAVTDSVPTEVVVGAHGAEMYEAATLLGIDHDMSDIGFAFGAQAEVVMALS